MSSTKITMHDIDESVKKALSPTEHIENKENPHEVTAEQVGALPLTGGTLSGNLLIGGGYSHFTADDSQTQINALNVSSDRANRRILAIRNSKNQPDLRYAFQVMDVVNNNVTPYHIYGEHNITKGTTDIGAGSALATGCIHLVYE